MHVLRKIAVWLAVAFLPLLLIMFATNYAILHSVGSAIEVKKVIKDSKLYDSAIDILLKETDNPNQTGQGGIRSDNPVVKDALQKAFPPKLIQSSTENYIDGVYSWLDGKTETPQFRIDLTEAKNTFVNEVAAGAQARAASLPACPRGQIEFSDPFAATCLPQGVSPAVAADKIRQDLAGGQENFLKNPVITADTFKNKNNQPVFSESSPLSENYQRLKKTQVILPVLAILALATIIFLSDSHRKGLKRAGITLLVVGITMLGCVWLSSWTINSQVIPKISIENSVLQSKVRTLVKDTSKTIGNNYYLFGGVYTGIGTLALCGALFINRGNKVPVATNTQAKPKALPKKLKT